MLEFSGHLFFDVGIATITAFAGKAHPTELVEQDFAEIADYMTAEYVRQPLRSFLTVVFPNSGFTQPAYFKQPEVQQDYADRVLRGYWGKGSIPAETCVYTGEPAVDIAFDVKDKLPPGRAFRQHVPLTLGEDVINFHPNGDAGLPISGKAMLAIQAFPLGCAKCGGRLLAVHSDNESLTLYFARTFLRENRKFIQLAQAAGSNKMPEPHFSHRTLLIDTLLNADEMQKDAMDVSEPFSLTVYHLSNSGQGPSLDIYYLPFEICDFLRDMKLALYRPDWQKIVNRAWEVPPKTKTKKREEFKPSRNWLYEDLFRLPDNAAHFVRTYFLRSALHNVRGKTDPRSEYSLSDEVGLVSWKITSRFLRRIMHMDAERIRSIRDLGDQLANYISTQNDRRFFQEFYRQKHYEYFRTALIKANLAHVKRGNPPFITLDPFIDVFEEGDELARRDWKLARDLVLIRVIEQLHENGWLGGNVDVIADDDTQLDADSES